MDNIIRETEMFAKVLEGNIHFYRELWTEIYPVQYYLGHNTILSKLPNEDLSNINPAYKDVDIKYYINSKGYRYYPDKSVKKNKKAFCFGCSFTLGHGLPDNETWPYILGEKLGEEWSIENYGKSGASFEEITRIFYQVIKNTPADQMPDAVFFLFPELTRRSYIGNIEDTPVHAGIVFEQNPEATHQAELKALRENTVDGITTLFGRQCKYEDAVVRVKMYAYTSAINSFFNNVSCFNIIRETCTRYNIPWSWYSWSYTYWNLSKEVIAEFMDVNNTVVDDNGLKPVEYKEGRSRDNTHCNGYVCEQFADILYKGLKK